MKKYNFTVAKIKLKELKRLLDSEKIGLIEFENRCMKIAEKQSDICPVDYEVIRKYKTVIKQSKMNNDVLGTEE